MSIGRRQVLTLLGACLSAVSFSRSAYSRAGEMRTFTSENVVATVVLKQMVVDWGQDLDQNLGRNVTEYFTEDCVVATGAIHYTGHAAMKKFYADREERIRTDQKDGVRTSRHGFTNLRVTFPEKNRATVTFLAIDFSGGGKAPLLDATTPTVVADSRFECRREADGQWRVAKFTGAPIFVGNDAFLNKTVVGR